MRKEKKNESLFVIVALLAAYSNNIKPIRKKKTIKTTRISFINN